MQVFYPSLTVRGAFNSSEVITRNICLNGRPFGGICFHFSIAAVRLKIERPGVDIGAIEFIHRQIIAMRDAGKAVLLVSVELDEILS